MNMTTDFTDAVALTQHSVDASDAVEEGDVEAAVAAVMGGGNECTREQLVGIMKALGEDLTEAELQSMLAQLCESDSIENIQPAATRADIQPALPVILESGCQPQPQAVKKHTTGVTFPLHLRFMA